MPAAHVPAGFSSGEGLPRRSEDALIHEGTANMKTATPDGIQAAEGPHRRFLLRRHADEA